MQTQIFDNINKFNSVNAIQYLNSRTDTERALGIVYTPLQLVNFMVDLATLEYAGPYVILEPACGDAPFLFSFKNKYGSNHKMIGIDIHPEEVRAARDKMPNGTFIENDYLQWSPGESFDVIIGNPPYGIIGDKSHYPIHVLNERKTGYKQKFKTWHGKYNIYGAFIEHSIKMLKPNGKLIFVVPASWLVLDDFLKLRLFLAHTGRITVYYLGKIFPKRNISVVVLMFERGKRGLKLYDKFNPFLERVNYRGEIIRFENEQTNLIETEGIPIEECFDIHFAARSPEIKRNQNVSCTPASGYVPILTGRNLHKGWIDYETCYSGFWMPPEKTASLRKFYSVPHLVVAHTKGTAVITAIDEKCYPWREEFHLIAKSEQIGLYDVMEYLNSEYIQNYTKQLYRDFVPHLTSVMLKRIPIPSNIANLPKNLL